MDTSNKNLISKTLAKRMMACIEEYRAIKNKASKNYKTVKEFCIANKFSHQNFMRILHRYEQNPQDYSLLPQKRGPKFQKRRTDLKIELRIKELREKGINRYDIRRILISENTNVNNNNISNSNNNSNDNNNDNNSNNNDNNNFIAPSLTTIYNISKKYSLNKLNKNQKQERRRYIMSKIGELVHIDCHQLSKGITIKEANKTYYLLGLIDDYSRLAWVEVMEDKKALTVMFTVLKAFNMLKNVYNVEIDKVMTDNGAEFGSGKFTKNKENHPFERLLIEMNMKHLYTKPYRPQTNGKIERFWKTLKEDFLEDALYNDLDDLKEELLGFIVYYNEHRGHSALNGKTPQEFSKECK